MAWTYAAWEEQSTPELRLEWLRKWRTELRNAISLEVDSTGNRVSSNAVRQTLADSEAPLARLEAQVASRATDGTRPLLVGTRTRTVRQAGGY